MAGAQKKRAVKEITPDSRSSEAQSSSHNSSGHRSSLQSIPKYDGNRDPQVSSPQGMRNPDTSPIVADCRNFVDTMGFTGWAKISNVQLPGGLVQRGRDQYNKNGRAVQVGLNTFDVLQMPQKPVYQYEVAINSDKRAVIKKVWNAKAVQNQLGPGWLFDGNKLAWSLKKMDQWTHRVNLDEEQGRTPARDKNIFSITIRFTNTVRFDSIEAYLSGKASFGNACIEAISCLDHLMRETPGQQYTQIKRSFFAKGEQRFDLGSGIEAFKGVFSSMRMARNALGRPGLSVNVDVANGTFWKPGKLIQSVVSVTKASSLTEFKNWYSKYRDNWDNSPLKRDLRRFSKVMVEAGHRPQDGPYLIDKFISKDPNQHRFELTRKSDDGQSETKEMVSIAQYFRMRYNVYAEPNIPLVKMTKGQNTIMPIDVLKIIPNQRYNFKLDSDQTSRMIRFAVTAPPARWEAVQHGLRMLGWETDTYLKNYGLKINPQRTVVEARVLPAPDVTFAGKKIPGSQASSGRWRIDGQKFLVANGPRPLRAWGVGFIVGRGGADMAATQRFTSRLMQVYSGHGGRIDELGRKPVIMMMNLAKGGEMVSDLWNATGNKFNMKPQFLVFIVPDRNPETYNRIKKASECRYGVVTQVLQAVQVQKCSDPYISNVCMKINAKLGGTTCRAVGNILPRMAGAKLTTMCVGADVSHPAPGSQGGSYAAITTSWNLDCTRYVAGVNTNGHRVEMIATTNFKELWGEMLQPWMSNINQGRFPDRIIYFRDGVSESQYQQVLQYEIRDMKDILLAINPNPKTQPKFVVVVGSKRHHIRFFPQNGGDRNGNPVPGTLVEKGVTHPFDMDFYLCAHSAIKGTARPVHYYVLMNEAGMAMEELQQFIYEHSYQYARSTTPVSLFPAIYYAHLASNRAKAHDQSQALSSGKKEQVKGAGTASKAPSQQAPGQQAPSQQAPPRSQTGQSQLGNQTKEGSHVQTKKGSTTVNDIEVPPLTPMNNQLQIKLSMWYI